MMKINEKLLRSIAVGSDSADKQGYLLKRDDQNNSFQKRWFVLKGNLLFYFEKGTDREPIGVIILQNCVAQMLESEEAYAFELNFEGADSRTCVLAAKTQEEMEDWMRTIMLASYDFMRLKVKEFNRQLDELNFEQNVSPSSSGAASKVPFTLELPSSLPLGGSLQPELGNFASDYSEIQQGEIQRDGIQQDEIQRDGWKTDTRVDQLVSNVKCLTDGRGRNFEKMHNDFGKNIQKKVNGGVCFPRL